MKLRRKEDRKKDGRDGREENVDTGGKDGVK
jgi:hypothetical protein